MSGIVEQQIGKIIAPTLQAMGFGLVQIALMDGKRRKTLQIMIDRLDMQPITVEDCAKVSHQVSALLDVEDPISGEYNLEISSPGIDRPLVKLEDYERFKGLEAKVVVYNPIDGFNDRKKYTGRIMGVDGNEILFLADAGQVPPDLGQDYVFKISFDNIQKAKLILNEELLKLHS